MSLDARARALELESERRSPSFIDSPTIAYPNGISRGIYLVWEDSRVSTSLVIFNYWRLRNGTNPSLRLILFSESGELLAVKDVAFGEGMFCQEIHLRPILEESRIPIPFRGSVWLEASGAGINFPHIGCVSQYRTETALAQVHTSHWFGDDKRPYIQDQHVPVWCGSAGRSFVYFPNGHKGASGALKCTLINFRGERREVVIDVQLSPFSTFFRFIDEVFPSAREMLGGEAGWLQIDLLCAGVNRRAFVGLFEESSCRIAVEHTTSYRYTPSQAPGHRVYGAVPWPDAANTDLDIYLNLPSAVRGTLRFIGNAGVVSSVLFDSSASPQFRAIPAGRNCPVKGAARAGIAHLEIEFDGLDAAPDLVAVWSRAGAPICFANLGTNPIKPTPGVLGRLRPPAIKWLRKIMVLLSLKNPVPEPKVKRPASKWAPVLGGRAFVQSFLAVHPAGPEDLVLSLKIYFEAGGSADERIVRIPSGTSKAFALDDLFPDGMVEKAGYLYAQILSGAGPMDDYYYYGVEKDSRNLFCDHAF